jgi:hypothetical protein
MKRSLKLVLGIVIASCALVTAATPPSRVHSSPTPALVVLCPKHLVAPYGGTDGWSTRNVQANFARSLVTPANKMVCQYRFGSGAPFFGIEKPCPAGSTCTARPKGFLVTP